MTGGVKEGDSMNKEQVVVDAVNEVKLVGRLGSTVAERELPSGDFVTSFTIVVDRPPRDRRGSATVDSISCQTFSGPIGARVMSWEPGSLVTVVGVLRRRFWRSAGGTHSVIEVQAVSVRKTRR